MKKRNGVLFQASVQIYLQNLVYNIIRISLRLWLEFLSWWPRKSLLSVLTALHPTDIKYICYMEMRKQMLNKYASGLWDSEVTRFILLNPIQDLCLTFSSIVGWDIMLQDRRLRVRVPIRSLNFFNLPNPSSRNMALGLTQPLTEMSTRKYFWGVESGRRISLTASPPTVSRLSRQCGIFNILKPYRPPRPVTGVALLSFYFIFNFGFYHRQ
jgi:hypothetical protein